MLVHYKNILLALSNFGALAVLDLAYKNKDAYTYSFVLCFFVFNFVSNLLETRKGGLVGAPRFVSEENCLFLKFITNVFCVLVVMRIFVVVCALDSIENVRRINIVALSIIMLLNFFTDSVTFKNAKTLYFINYCMRNIFLFYIFFSILWKPYNNQM